MSDIRAKHVPASIEGLSFNCPHCGALAQQFWFTTHSEPMKKDDTPLVLDPDRVAEINLKHIEDPDERVRMMKWARRAVQGRPFLERNPRTIDFDIHNVSISQCYNCDDISIWIYNRLIWPQRGEAPLPNPDLPDEILRDYNEAGSILDYSPRGSAALLRLAIQKLCRHLGENSKNLDDTIAALVKKGLDVRVQQALDVVRVIGNNAVHPGQIELSDDPATAEKLFGLVNLIAEIMISQPKHVADMFDGPPESARLAIERRDKKQ